MLTAISMSAIATNGVVPGANLLPPTPDFATNRHTEGHFLYCLQNVILPLKGHNVLNLTSLLIRYIKQTELILMSGMYIVYLYFCIEG